MAGAMGDTRGRSLTDILRRLGWAEIVFADPFAATPTDGRTDYRDELLLDHLRDRVRSINPGPDGEPWLDDARLDVICDKLHRAAAMSDLIDSNRAITELFVQGVVVDGDPDWDGGRGRTVKLIDWDNSERNDLRVIENFRLDRPLDGGPRFVVLDCVLFVNGLPLAVVRHPSTDREPTVAEAIADLRSFTGQRQDGPREGVPGFFRYVQMLVATDGTEQAKLGTITSAPEHFAEWKTVEPASRDRIIAEFGVSPNRLTALERLAAGVLRPSHLLDLVQNFTAFHSVDGRMVKLLARYPQFRAVQRIVYKLRTGRPPAPGRADERGGTVWHTQGSGKSYTMAFIIRKMRSTPGLSNFKVAVAVDRVDLRQQLADSLAIAGESVIEASGVASARMELSDDVPNVVMIMMQHAQRDADAAVGAAFEERLGSDTASSVIHFPELTQSERVLVLVDEAHRGQSSWLHARLRRGLPGAAWVGFTGTPLTREDRRRNTTIGIFGGFVDTYTLQDAVTDGATVPIRYEQRRAEAYLVDRVELDFEYEREVGGTPAARELSQQRITTRQALESEQLIADKARDMVRHWVETVLPNGFKAQVAAATRLAAVRYRAALRTARDELVVELADYDAALRNDPDAARAQQDAAFLNAALPFLPLLRIIDFVPVISEGRTRDPTTGQLRADPPLWSQWTTDSRQRDHIARFRRPLPAPETLGSGPGPRGGNIPWSSSAGGSPWSDSLLGSESSSHPVHQGPRNEPWGAESPDDSFDRSHGAAPRSAQGPPHGGGPAPIAFVIVQAMLLTGFDAPVEQVLYLDRAIRDLELLQAIARVNRPARLKTVGLVVDYAGVSRHLDAALSAYEEEDLAETKIFLRDDDVTRLREAHESVRQFLDLHEVGPLTDGAELDKLLTVVADPRLRVEFDELLGGFFRYLDRVLPRPAALRYEDDAGAYGVAQYRVRRCYRETRSGSLDPYTFGAKVRYLLDQHIRVSSIVQRIPPVEITAADFRERVAALTNPKVRALEMEHALRRRIAERTASDPAYYERLSERLERILAQLRSDAEQLALALDELVREVRERETVAEDHGLDQRTEAPIRSLLELRIRQVADTAADMPPPDADNILTLTRNLHRLIRNGVQPPHFSRNEHLQARLRRQIRNYLLDCDLHENIAGPLAEELLEFARFNRGSFLDHEPGA
jgi:type I restriction enzyme R subunit